MSTLIFQCFAELCRGFHFVRSYSQKKSIKIHFNSNEIICVMAIETQSKQLTISNLTLDDNTINNNIIIYYGEYFCSVNHIIHCYYNNYK